MSTMLKTAVLDDKINFSLIEDKIDFNNKYLT
jgi:hypothetical protein